MMSTFRFALSCTAARASASVDTQKGTSVRPGSGAVMPRPAVRKRAVSGMVWLGADLIRDITLVLSHADCSDHAVIGTTLQVFDERLTHLGTQMTWASRIAGITVLPARLTRVAPSAPGLHQRVRPARTGYRERQRRRSRWVRGVATITRAPSNTVVGGPAGAQSFPLSVPTRPTTWSGPAVP